MEWHGLRKRKWLSVRETGRLGPNASGGGSTKGHFYVLALFLSLSWGIKFLVGTWLAWEAGGGWGRRNAALALSQKPALPGTALYLAGQGALTEDSEIQHAKLCPSLGGSPQLGFLLFFRAGVFFPVSSPPTVQRRH